ncbi:MAG TPA: zinc ribbon domain-containing protein [Armatimonadota bacterium]|nr:zinc ribbon domain-containing protein [Armatimonadota bacterium]
MDLQNTTSTTICPYCANPVSPFGGSRECGHCGRPIFSVSCPKCGRPTLNLTLIVRYGKATCFGCQTEIDSLPDESPRATAPVPALVAAPVNAAKPSPVTTNHAAHPTITPRAPKNPIMPTAAEARAVVEKCLVGLERAAQDREMLRAPDLRAVVMQYLDIIQAVFDLDAAMERGEITEEWLQEDQKHLDAIADYCFSPLWPHEGALLPPTTQAWVLVVDDAARRWQYARRRWLEDTCKLTLMPTVPNVTTVNPAWHVIEGKGQVITAVRQPGFFLHGEVLRKAHVSA